MHNNRICGLTLTSSAWVMKGFFTDCIYDNSAAATQFFANAVDLLTRGRSLWPDVPKAERGTIFEETFIMGVRMLHMVTFLHVSFKPVDGKKLTTLLVRQMLRSAAKTKGLASAPWRPLRRI